MFCGGTAAESLPAGRQGQAGRRRRARSCGAAWESASTKAPRRQFYPLD